MRKMFLAMIFALSISNVFAGVVGGSVSDSSSSLSLSLVKVKIDGPGLKDSTFTDSLGKFSFKTPVKVSNLPVKKISAMPNIRHSGDMITWRDAQSPVSLMVFSASGRLVEKFSSSNSLGSFSLAKLPSGMYLMKMNGLVFKYLRYGNGRSWSDMNQALLSSSFDVSADVGDVYTLSFIKTSFDTQKVVVADGVDSLKVGMKFIANAVYRLDCINFSPYKNGQNPNNKVFIPRHQIIERMSIVKPYTKSIRIFSTLSGLGASCEVAHKFGLKTFAGAWIGRDTAVNRAEIDSLIAMSLRGEVDTAIIGSEALLRQDINEDSLIAHLQRFRTAVPNVPVTTADVYGELIGHPKVLAVCDFVYGNFYPYWEGVDVKYAVASLDASYENLLDTSGGKRVLISEAGWPSEGTLYGQSLPSKENAAYYFLNLVSWSRAKKISINYFEAFDESWKTNEGTVGQHWGLFDTAGVMKAGMEKVFQGDTMVDNWTGDFLVGGEGVPAIDTVFVPKIGTSDNLQGKVLHVKPKDYGIVVYINVPGAGWWIKPTYASPVTKINPDGSWICDVTTGGSDQTATKFHVFLIPKDYTPPSSYSTFNQEKKVAELLIIRE